nr:RnfABCDGE type electron transport complex subunit D [uncultured Blautia sp.]
MSQTRVINGPHIRTERTTRSVMMHVSISLIPALLGAIYFFGIRALYLAGLSITVCVLTEYIWQKVTRKQVTAGDFSAVVTGLLLVLNMPVTVPIWTLVAADVFSILVVKQMFGGIGNNFVNPALMGRLLTMVAWPGAVMQYVAPRTLETDAVSAATVLGAVKTGGEQGYSYLQMYFWTRRAFHRRYSAESFWRRTNHGRLLYAVRLCLCVQKRKTALCGCSRCDYCGNQDFQCISGGNLLWYLNS